jgi:hypothetical protein
VCVCVCVQDNAFASFLPCMHPDNVLCMGTYTWVVEQVNFLTTKHVHTHGSPGHHRSKMTTCPVTRAVT